MSQQTKIVLDKHDQLHAALRNYRSTKYSIANLLKDFKAEVDRVKTHGNLSHLLNNRKEIDTSEDFFSMLINNSLVLDDELKHLYEALDSHKDFHAFLNNRVLFCHLLKSKTISFDRILDDFLHNPNCLYIDFLGDLLYDEKLFIALFKENALSNKDIQSLLYAVRSSTELIHLRNNNKELQYRIFSYNLLTAPIVGHLNAIIDEAKRSIYASQKTKDIKNIFSFFRVGKRDADLIELINFNEYSYSFSLFNDDDRNRVFELLRSDEVAQQQIPLIVETGLAETFHSFSDLSAHLSKSQRKHKLCI